MNAQTDKLGQLSAQMYHLYGEWAKKHAININMLAVFYTIDKYQQCTQKQVCEEWIVPKQTISTLCKQLHQQGYIEFAQGLQDKREKTMVLTEQGKQHAAPILAQLKDLEQRILTAYGEPQMAQLLDHLQRFTEVFVRVA